MFFKDHTLNYSSLSLKNLIKNYHKHFQLSYWNCIVSISAFPKSIIRKTIFYPLPLSSLVMYLNMSIPFDDTDFFNPKSPYF